MVVAISVPCVEAGFVIILLVVLGTVVVAVVVILVIVACCEVECVVNVNVLVIAFICVFVKQLNNVTLKLKTTSGYLSTNNW